MLGDRYRVVRFLGAGAMATVHEVEDPNGRRHAAKVFAHLPEQTRSADGMARFIREARISQRIDSPHVVPVIDVAVDEDLRLPFFVMPLVNGMSLDAVLERLGPLHPVVATRIVLQACEGLEAAHAHGIVHRDIKPSNLLFDHVDGGSITVRVCDFGIAKWPAGGEDLTQTGSMLGTPLYMAPEQALNAKDVDARVDVWSAAMTLYHALAGQPAYERVGGMGGLLIAMAKRDVPPLQDIAPWVEPALARVVHGALVRDRDLRCPDIDSLKAALMPHAGGTHALRAEHLGPLSPKVREYVAQRAPLPRAWRDESEAGNDVIETAVEPATEDAFEGASLLERYKIKRLIGRGGMAAVYEAEAADGTPVAVKVLLDGPGGRDTEMRRRLVREARALKAIASPYVVRVVDADTYEQAGTPFIVMELLRGTDLEHLIHKWGALSPEPVVRLFALACRGLAQAHAAGLVHRDVKPANLFIHHLPNGEVLPKLCDFGIAKQHLFRGEEALTVQLTRTGGIIGSPLYMSPEQAQSAKHVDRRTDIWSLGLSLWEALSGNRPWEEYNTVGELIVAICTVPMKPLRDVAPWVDPGLARVVDRCLAKSPDDRFPDADALALALEPFAYPSDHVHRNLLVPVPMHQRNANEWPPSAQAGYRRGSLEPAASTHRGDTTAHGGGGSFRAYAAVGTIACLALGAGVWAYRQGQVSSAAEITAPAAAAESRHEPAPAVVASTSAWLRIAPPSAEVAVDGTPTAVVDGGIALMGNIGETVLVEARSGQSRAAASIALTQHGAVPSAMEVPPETLPAATQNAPRGRPAGPKTPVAATQSSPPPPSVAPSPSPHETTPAVTPKDEWQ
jgi:serine/threonine protein kinase